MNVTPLRTGRVSAGTVSLTDFLDEHLERVPEESVVVIASKVVSLCENRVAPPDASKDELIAQESERYLPPLGPYRYRFTITHGTLIPAAGIDQSNVGGGYLLWPRDPQASANLVRRHLRARHGVGNVGVLITDSTCTPLRRGTVGIAVAHSGFRAVNSYIGRPDLFGRPLEMSEANVAAGLAAAAVTTMGEGDESTPLCLIESVPHVRFQEEDPTDSELAELLIDPSDDLFAPFLEAVPWSAGGRAGSGGRPGETPGV